MDLDYIQSAREAKCCFCERPLKRNLVNQKDPAEGYTPWMCWNGPCWARAMEWAVHTTEKSPGLKPKNIWLFGPTPKQVKFFEHTRTTKHTLFGGAKSVAKSYGLRWLAYRDCLRIPGLRILLLRRTYGELEISHLLDMPLEAELMKPAGAVYKSAAREMSFGNKSLIRAGHCETDADVAKFLSSQWDRIIFDEIVTFPLKMFLSIASCARTAKPQVMLEGGAQVWAATNPGGRGARWVKEFFVDHEVDLDEFPNYKPEQWGFVQGWLEDNPYVEEGYRQTLENMPPVLRRQWLYGDWEAFEGMFFDFSTRKDGQPWHVADLHLVA